MYFSAQLWICIRRAIVEDGVLVKVYGEMSSCCAARSGRFRSTVLESNSLCEQESKATMGLQEKDENTGNER